MDESITKLTLNGSALGDGATIYFNSGSSFTITTFNLTGMNSNNLIILRPTTGVAWTLKNTGSAGVSFVDVQLSNAGPGNTIYATNSIDSGSNVNWKIGQFTWTGAVDNNWSNASNWDSTVVPGPGDAPLIPSAAPRMPTLTQSVTISTLTIMAGSSLTLSGFNLTLSSFTNYGTFVLLGSEAVSSAPSNLAGSTVTYNGGGVVTSTWTYANLAINNMNGTFQATGALSVSENLTLTTGTFNANNKDIAVGGAWQNTSGMSLN